MHRKLESSSTLRCVLLVSQVCKWSFKCSIKMLSPNLNELLWESSQTGNQRKHLKWEQISKITWRSPCRYQENLSQWLCTSKISQVWDWGPDGLKYFMLIWALIIFISLMKDQQFLSAGDSWSGRKLSLRNETKKSKCYLTKILLYRATLKVFCSCIGNHIKVPHTSTLLPHKNLKIVS